MASISDDLRAELGRVFLLGFLDASAGTPVEDEDLIPADLAPPLVQMAEAAVDGGEAMIAELYRENPQTVCQTLYSVGWETCQRLDHAFGPAEVNLN